MTTETTRRTTPSSNPPAESYPAELYAAVHDGNPGDVHFYRCACAGASRVLELGCGTGRVATALAADGIQVTGVDNASERLDVARRFVPQATFVHGDMRELDTLFSAERFDRVIIPFTGLYCLTNREDMVKTLLAASRRLTPEGLVVFDVYNADHFHAEAPAKGQDEPDFVKTVRAMGGLWDVFEHSVWDQRDQRIDAIYEHVSRDGQPTIRASIPQRYLRSEEIPQLLSDAGLELLVLHGDFDQSAYDKDSSLLIATARAAVEA